VVVPFIQARTGASLSSLQICRRRKEPTNIQVIGFLIALRLKRKLGQLSAATMAKVKDTIRFALEL